MRTRPEWTLQATLSPADALADPPDGTLLDGWDSACLTVVYQPGRAVARLACCAEDAGRLAALRLPGWRLAVRPGPIARILSGGAWRGVPSFAPVPGAVIGVAPARVSQEEITAPSATLAPDLSGALTADEGGLLLGVAPDGSAVRLARRAMTLALCASPEARQSAVLALMRRGMQAGLGMVVAVDRALLPSEALAAWEARARLLDVQDVASSAAIPWRQIAPELLAQAIAGPGGRAPWRAPAGAVRSGARSAWRRGAARAGGAGPGRPARRRLARGAGGRRDGRRATGRRRGLDDGRPAADGLPGDAAGDRAGGAHPRRPGARGPRCAARAGAPGAHRRAG